MTTDVFTVTDNWLCPPGVTEVMIECWGAGSSGLGTSGPGTASRGGGGGAYARSTLDVTPSSLYTVTVGAPGASGGLSEFVADSETVRAVGGSAHNGGDEANCLYNEAAFSGGAAGLENSGSQNSGGSGGGGAAGTIADGSDSADVGSSSGGSAGGAGGNVDGGDGGKGGSVIAGQWHVGEPGELIGGGGGGASGRSNLGGVSGGLGGRGEVRITYTGALPTVTVEVDAIADTYLRNDAVTANYGAAINALVGERNNTVSAGRSLLKFDLSAIPDAAQISAVTLSLYLTEDRASFARDWEVYRSLRAWVEGSGNGTATGDGATWNTYNGVDSWQSAGGFGANDCEQVPIGAALIGASESVGYVDIPILVATKSELDNGNGWLVKNDGENNDAYYFSTREATAGQRPKLTIEYADPSAGGSSQPFVRSPMWGRF